MRGRSSTPFRSDGLVLTAYIDCFSGVSGDMLLGALLDLGWPMGELQVLPDRLGLEGVDIQAGEVRRKGLRGMHVKVVAGDVQPLRTMSHITPIIEEADLPGSTKKKALEAFGALCTAESRAHGVSPEQVHFHEIGAVDTLIDIIGVISGFNFLELVDVVCSPLPVPRGWVDSAHGPLPLPAPACAELLRGVPVYGVDVDRELVTPTGLALLRVLAGRFDSFPEMTVRDVGYGAGARDLETGANLIRIWIGESRLTSEQGIMEIRTHIDDMNPQWYQPLIQRLFDAGALDVAISPIQMKKGRPGTELTVIVRLGTEQEISRLVLEHSTSTGVRVTRCLRFKSPRQEGVVGTKWGKIKAKLITRPSGRKVLAPEYDDCLRVSSEASIPLEVVFSEVAAAGEQAFEPAGED